MVVGEAGSGVTASTWVIISALAMSHKPKINCGVLLAEHVLDSDWQRPCLRCSPFPGRSRLRARRMYVYSIREYKIR